MRSGNGASVPFGRLNLYGSLEPTYVDGLIVQGDVLQQLRGIILTNDFPAIHTLAGDPVALFDLEIAKLKQGLDAHSMTRNYLEY